MFDFYEMMEPLFGFLRLVFVLVLGTFVIQEFIPRSVIEVKIMRCD